MRYIYFVIALLMMCPAAFSDESNDPSLIGPEYTLSVSCDILHSSVRGHARIAVSGERELVFNVSHLSIHDVTINGRKIGFTNGRDIIRIKTKEEGVLEIGYEGTFRPSRAGEARDDIIDNVISEQGISLTGIWYPRLDGLMTYRLTALLPDSYEAISEAEHIASTIKAGKREFTFFFDHPVDHLTFVASDRYKILRDRSGAVDFYAYFFEEDLDLAKQYVEHAKEYIDMYRKLIYPYPYHRFSIVENILPTGYSMPTFTLLGRDVVKLPFIVETSLGHEILHQWFGNSVYVDYKKGNWSEGLTTYLSDYLYEEQKGNGADYRKQIMIDYQSYVNNDNVFPLREFRGRTDFSSKTIGYGKAAMLFHMLRKDLGDNRFYEALKDFVKKNSFRKASWGALISSFETTSGIELENIFNQWLDSPIIPGLQAGRALVRQKAEGYETSFSLKQEGGPFNLTVPITIYAGGTKETIPRKIDKTVNIITLYSRERPEKIVIDEDYDVMRKLSLEEFPPIIARIIDDKSLVVGLPVSKNTIYENIIDAFKKKGAMIKENLAINDADLSNSSFIILGNDNPLLERFRGVIPRDTTSDGFTISVNKNPFNTDKVIALISAASGQEADTAFPKIFHYGKFSRLAFSKGKNILKETAPSKRGLIMELETDAPAVHVPDVKSLSQVIDNVRDKRIVYVGEEHSNYAHHAVQLEVIQGLLEKDKKIVIGMEMFQRPYQAVLDDYVNGAIDRKTFLKKTEYFARWRFDYELYKPIIDFARENRIPIIALNIEREILELVSKNGLDALPSDIKVNIPPDMDFSDDQYRERLKKVFSEHTSLKDRNFDFFFQSQILWDETMSQSADKYLSTHSDYRMIILAGSGHLLYGSGIPKRTFRRSGLSYAVILSDVDLDKDVADYVIFPRYIEGTKPVRMMVLLNEEKGKVTITGFPDNSISKKAGLEEGDTILSLDDVPVTSIEDVKIFLVEKKKGDTICVEVLRKNAAEKGMQTQFKLVL
jgi:aminopeptidase N